MAFFITIIKPVLNLDIQVLMLNFHFWLLSADEKNREGAGTYYLNEDTPLSSSVMIKQSRNLCFLVLIQAY